MEVFWKRMDMSRDDGGFNLLDMLVYYGGMFKHPCLESQLGKPLRQARASGRDALWWPLRS